MPEMIATSEIEYPPGSCWKPGDRFEVEEAHVELLTLNGRAKLPEATTAAAEVPRRGRGPQRKAR